MALTKVSGEVITRPLVLTGNASVSGIMTVGIGSTTTTIDGSQDFPTIRPTLDLNFAATKTLDRRITFTRDSIGTYTDEFGIIQTVPNNVPRFDHDPVTGESLGLLIEESRTNLVTYSEDVSNAAWSKNNSSIQSNSIVSPFGDTTADKVFDDTTTGATHTISLSFTKSAVFYTGSVYVKAGEYTKVALGFVGVSNWDGIPQALFDLSTEQVTSVGSDATANITPVGNGWYRCILTAESLNTTSSGLSIGIISDSGTNVGGGDIFLGHDGDGSSGLYVWGAQVEAGSFPTSYIPTSGSTVTRATDVAKITGTNFTDFYNQSEGSVSVRFNANGPSSASGFGRIYEISDGTTDNRYGVLLLGTSSSLYESFSIGGNGNVDFDEVSISFNSFYNHVSAFKLNDYQRYINVNGNIEGLTDESIAINNFTPNILKLGGHINNVNGILNGYISRFTYYNKRLTNSQLQSLTRQ